ncbi:MAG: hypothetical protein GY861_25770 [bacterium]|nr:hypothetical protein [bacterium]
MMRTKGKWKVSRGANKHPYSIESESKTIAYVNYVQGENIKDGLHLTLDNAKLLASAPDLLEACEGLIEYVRIKHNVPINQELSCEHMQNIEQAIKKAKGE